MQRVLHEKTTKGKNISMLLRKTIQFVYAPKRRYREDFRIEYYATIMKFFMIHTKTNE
jgi:hypothetical protein